MAPITLLNSWSHLAHHGSKPSPSATIREKAFTFPSLSAQKKKIVTNVPTSDLPEYHFKKNFPKINIQSLAHIAKFDIWNKLTKLVAGISAGAALLYFISHSDTVPITDRRRILSISNSLQLQLTEEARNEVNEHLKYLFLPEDHPHVQLVEKIGFKLVNNSGLSRIHDINWQFRVVNTDQEGVACTTQDGTICLFRRFLDEINDENSLAMIMGHEIAHVAAKHLIERWGVVNMAMFFTFAHPESWLGRVFQKPFFKRCEFEADYIGLILMARAGYDPNYGPVVLQQLQQKYGKEVETENLFEYHPSYDTRIKRLKEVMQFAELEFQRATQSNVTLNQPLYLD